MTSQALVRVAQSHGLTVLPDNALWTNRFEIMSETSDRLYTVAQRKADGTWGCSCPAWRTRRDCKHLRRIVPLLTSDSPSPPRRLIGGR